MENQPQPDQRPAQPIVEQPATSNRPQLASIYPEVTHGQNVFTPQVPQQPQLQTQPPVQPQGSTPGVIVLQWLTYSFWGWTILAMSFLCTLVLSHFIAGFESGTITPYPVAAILVLLPISIICDVFYSKHEPTKKTGASSVVMIIHAVIFALFGIGALIGGVISLVTLFTSSGDHKNSYIALASSGIVVVLYGLTFLRTLNPKRIQKLPRYFAIIMTVIVGIVAVLGLLPVVDARKTRDDRLIENNLSSINSTINNYATINKQLPPNLSSLTLSGDPKTVVDRNLVTYSIDIAPVTTTQTSLGSYSTYSLTKSTVLYYQLCATYIKASPKSNTGYDYTSSYQETDGYSTYLSTYKHDAGKNCYKLKTYGY